MLQRDYFMRLVEMLTAVLTKVLLNKEKKDYIEAEKEIEIAAKTIVGLDLKMLKILDIENLVLLMKSTDLYAGRFIVSAELLNEYGEIFKLTEKENESIDIHQKTLRLYIEALLTKEIPDSEKYYPKINELISNLSSTDFSDEMNIKIIDYYEFSLQYSKAEDKIFDLLETQNPEIKSKAISFYKKLITRSDEELLKGNLNREEVEAGLEEILNLKY